MPMPQRARIPHLISYKRRENSYSRKGLLIKEEHSSDLQHNSTSVSVVVLIILILLRVLAAGIEHTCLYLQCW